MKGSLRKFIGRLPHGQKRLLKRARYFPSDLWTRLTRGDSTLPPKWLRFDSESDFEEVGNHLLSLCVEYGGLQPSCDVLDIGCGVGRFARPLTGFLSSDNHYEGFDVDALAINWCRNHLAKRHPNFGFQHVSVVNDHYNPDAAVNGDQFQFPYENDSFDFAVATSLFTHLASDDATRYLMETSRVLKPEGKALLTWYVIEDEQIEPAKDLSLSFQHRVDKHSFTDTPHNPGAAMAFSRHFTLQAIREAGLSVVGDIQPGTWRGDAGPTFQDLIIVSKD
ncbi:methyltransferase type 11 [gamma proteobacterium NOR5-3]|nr:methyltransferase type 11 [gamma proteobacterium NOR5-3]